MAILSLLLFNAPSGHLRDLQGIFMDQIVSQLSWKRLMEKVLSEWQDMTLYVRRPSYFVLSSASIENTGVTYPQCERRDLGRPGQFQFINCANSQLCVDLFRPWINHPRQDGSAFQSYDERIYQGCYYRGSNPRRPMLSQLDRYVLIICFLSSDS
jgi:hypothetical protein